MRIRRLGIVRAIFGEAQQNKIADAWQYRNADLGHLFLEAFEPLIIMASRCFDMRLILDRSQTGSQRRAGVVERAAHPVDHIDHLFRAVAPAEAERGEAVDFREGPGHHHVATGLDQLGAGIVIIGCDKFRVGRIDDEQNIFRQCAPQAAHFRFADIAAGWIVGVGEKQNSRLVRNMGEQCIDIGTAIGFRRRYRRGSGGARGYFVNEKAMPAEQHLIAGSGIGFGQQLQNLV